MNTNHKSPKRCALSSSLVGLALLLSTSAIATPIPFEMLVERDDDSINLGNNIWMLGYDNLPDLITPNLASNKLTSQSLSTSTSVGGIAYDGSQYHVLVERDDDSINLGNDIWILSYNSLQDIVDANLASNQLTGQNLSVSTSVGGFTYDGSQFHILVERDDDSIALGNDIWILSYDSLLDIVTPNLASNNLTGQSLSTSTSVGGLAYDGSQYHMLVERDDDSIGLGNDMWILSYDSLQDIITPNLASNNLTGQSLSTSTSAGGLVAIRNDDPQSVSEPPVLAILLGGLLTMLQARRSRKFGDKIRDV